MFATFQFTQGLKPLGFEDVRFANVSGIFCFISIEKPITNQLQTAAASAVVFFICLGQMDAALAFQAVESTGAVIFAGFNRAR